MSAVEVGRQREVVTRRTKRLSWGAARLPVCFKTLALGVPVARIARRHAVNANLIVTCLREPRHAPDPTTMLPKELGQRFSRIEIVAADEAPIGVARMKRSDAHGTARIARAA